MELNKVYNENCLIGMSRIADKSIDLILADLPYGTTACKWDTIIPFKPLWEHYERIIKDNGAIVLTASQPFTSALVMSNPKLFKYEWIWKKDSAANFGVAKYRPLNICEAVLVFAKKPTVYNPQMWDSGRKSNKSGKFTKGDVYGANGFKKSYNDTTMKFPTNILEYSKPKHNDKYGTFHPTQKPVPLFEYLIKTYTNEGETVLDNCMGSFTTAISAINTNRNYIGFEMDETYFKIGSERVKKHMENKTDLFNIAI